MASSGSAQILFRCNACGKAFRVPPEMAGQTAKCSGCGKILSIPGANPSAVFGQLRGHTTRTASPIVTRTRTQRRPPGAVQTGTVPADDEITSLCSQCGEEYPGRNPLGLCPNCTAAAEKSRHRPEAMKQDMAGESEPESAEVCPACRHPIRLGAQTCRHCGRDFRAAKRRKLAHGPSGKITVETSLCARCGEEYEGRDPKGLCLDCKRTDEVRDDEPQNRPHGGNRKVDADRELRAPKATKPVRRLPKGISVETSLCSQCGGEYEGPHPLGLCPDCRSADAGSAEDEPQEHFDDEGPDSESKPEPEDVCLECGEPFRPGARICAHCGHRIRAGKRPHSAGLTPEHERSPRRPVKLMSMAALGLGLAGLSGLAFPYLVLISVGGLVLGVLALLQAMRSSARSGGKPLAIAGIAVSVIAIVVVCVQVVRSRSGADEAEDASSEPKFSQPALPPPSKTDSGSPSPSGGTSEAIAAGYRRFSRDGIRFDFPTVLADRSEDAVARMLLDATLKNKPSAYGATPPKAARNVGLLVGPEANPVLLSVTLAELESEPRPDAWEKELDALKAAAPRAASVSAVQSAELRSIGGQLAKFLDYESRDGGRNVSICMYQGKKLYLLNWVTIKKQDHDRYKAHIEKLCSTLKID